jgi:hypothetical protein
MLHFNSVSKRFALQLVAIGLASTAVLPFATNAFAVWKEQVSKDRLTGRENVRMENAAFAPIRINGHAIVPRLVLQCLTPSDGESYIGAFIVFGEPVAAIPESSMRLRIDDSEVETRLVGSSPRGDYIQIVAPEEFVPDRLRNSSRLRVEVPLLDGNVFMQFNTSGTQAAIDKTGCPKSLTR